jgi:hypothetical protein
VLAKSKEFPLMRFLFVAIVLFSVGTVGSFAQDLPAHCDDNAGYRGQLQSIGPVVSVGASASSGMFARSFPLLVAQQMCLTQGSGFQSRHTFSGATKFPFLKKAFQEQRPKIIIALDHLHHSSKGKKFNAETRKYIDAEIAMLTLDCNHPAIDCTPGGDFHFVKTENYRPIVLLGDIYAFYAVDCARIDPFVADEGNYTRDKGCIDDYNEINKYIRHKAAEASNLFIFPVDSFYRNLHQGLPFLYDIAGRRGSFYSKDLFWDGFHPRSEPGVQVLANMVLTHLNELIAKGTIKASVTIPYIKIAEEYFKPFTGVVLIKDKGDPLEDDKKLRFVSEKGEEIVFAFSDQTKSFRSVNGDWGYSDTFERGAKSLVERAGHNPLVIRIVGIAHDNAIVIPDHQLALLQRISDDPRNQLLGGVITVIE